MVVSAAMSPRRSATSIVDEASVDDDEGELQLEGALYAAQELLVAEDRRWERGLTMLLAVHVIVD